MVKYTNEFYGGSLLLTPLADLIGLPIDQINFLVCQLVALAVAFQFRRAFSVESVGVHTRHVIEICVGVFLTLFCFGYQIFHILAQSMVSYALMAYGGRKGSHNVVFVYSILYLAVCHIYRQIYDYGGYTLDVTGPLMIQTQRLTSLAYALHDGRYKKESELSKDQKAQSVKKLPSLLEYLSYNFCFHGILLGPLAFYNDYIAFIDGSFIVKAGVSSSQKKPLDNLNQVVTRKLLMAFGCCVAMLVLPNLFFSPATLNTPEFYNMHFINRWLFLVGVMTFSRFKYYFAWILIDAVNNMAGLGFSGYDSDGNPQWDLTSNVDIAGIELSTSLKVNIESWNKTTTVWLRRVVYERARFHNTLAVFAISAFWHGFYPAYYITFATGVIMTFAARKVRRRVRPFFQTSPSLKSLYEVITFIVTRLANGYITFPFLILEFYACFYMFRSLYFLFHVLSILALQFFAFFPAAKKPVPPSDVPNSPVAPSDDPSSSVASADASTSDEISKDK